MGKSSRSIKLALLGSALLLPGCQDRDEEWPAEVAADFEGISDDGGYFGPPGEAVAGGQAVGSNGDGSNNGVHHRSPAAGIGGAIIGSQIARSMMRGGSTSAPSAPAAPSARGGFGSTGGMSASS